MNTYDQIAAAVGYASPWFGLCTYALTRAIERLTPEKKAAFVIRWPRIAGLVDTLAGFGCDSNLIRQGALAIARGRNAPHVVALIEKIANADNDDRKSIAPLAPILPPLVIPPTTIFPPPVMIEKPPPTAGRFSLVGDEIPQEAQPSKEKPYVSCRNDPSRVAGPLGPDRIG